MGGFGRFRERVISFARARGARSCTGSQSRSGARRPLVDNGCTGSVQGGASSLRADMGAGDRACAGALGRLKAHLDKSQWGVGLRHEPVKATGGAVPSHVRHKTARRKRGFHVESREPQAFSVVAVELPQDTDMVVATNAHVVDRDENIIRTHLRVLAHAALCGAGGRPHHCSPFGGRVR